MSLRIDLPGSSALQNDGLDVPVILQCRAPQETNPKRHGGPNYFLRKSCFDLPPGGPSMSWVPQSRCVHSLACTYVCIMSRQRRFKVLSHPIVEKFEDLKGKLTILLIVVDVDLRQDLTNAYSALESKSKTRIYRVLDAYAVGLEIKKTVKDAAAQQTLRVVFTFRVQRHLCDR
jgi:hypothetical protein